MKNQLLTTLTLLLLPFILISQNISPEASTYAVVIGISDYQDKDIPDLQFAHRDAEAFAGFLQSPAGGSLPNDHIRLLTNEKATAGQIITVLSWLLEMCQPGDKAIIYFSGHGDVETISKFQLGYLLTWDSPPAAYNAGAIPLNFLQAIISSLSQENKAQVFVITDACRAGKLSGSAVGGTQITNANLLKLYNDEIKILSCQPDEFSIEGKQWGGGHGIFSYHLLDGMYGLADQDGDLSVTLLELNNYLENKVPKEADPHLQIPMTVGGKSNRVAIVDKGVLSKIKTQKNREHPRMEAVVSRSLENLFYEKADSNNLEIYKKYVAAIERGDLMASDEGGSSENDYFEQLIQKPELQFLHGYLKRNFAAALQDNAQQVMNIMLKSGLTEWVLKAAYAKNIYKYYPAYLERAAELLGRQHYMYPILQARKLFFEGQIETNRKVKRSFYQKALKIQPDMAQAMVKIIGSYKAEQADSAQYYFQKSTELIPSWVEPYLAMAFFYEFKLKKLEKAAEMLDFPYNQQENSRSAYSYTD